MTARELASKIGVSEGHMSNILAGKRRPSSEIARRLEAVTGVELKAWLFPAEYKNPMVKK